MLLAVRFDRLLLLVGIVLLQHIGSVPIEVTLQHGEKLGADYYQDTGIINRVENGSRAEIQGVRIDMKITHVNGERFSHEEIRKCTSGIDPCTLTLLPVADYASAGGIYRKIAENMYNTVAEEANKHMSVGVSWAARWFGSDVRDSNDITNDPQSGVHDNVTSNTDLTESLPKPLEVRERVDEEAKPTANKKTQHEDSSSRESSPKTLDSEDNQETTASGLKPIESETPQETTQSWWHVDVARVSEGIQETTQTWWKNVPSATSFFGHDDHVNGSNETINDAQNTSGKAKPSFWDAATHAAARMFTSSSPDEVLVEIENARKAENLGTILAKFPDDPKVVQAVTDALMLGHRFTAQCVITNEVARHSWAAQTSMQTKELAAIYLRFCFNYWSPAVRKLVLEASVDLLKQPSDASKAVQASPQVVRDALHFLKNSLESDTLNGTSGVEAALDRSPYNAIVQMLPAAEDSLPCEVLRALVRHAKPNSTIMNSETTSIWDLAELRKIVRNRKKHALSLNVEVDTCLSILMDDLRRALTLGSSPLSIIRPEKKVLSRSLDLLPGEDLEFALRRKIVGQDCLIAQLADDPGYVLQKMKGYWNSRKPLVFLFLGPSGVGKTALASLIAEAIHGKPSEQLRREGLLTVIGMDKFSKEEDKWNLFGPPAGTVGEAKLAVALAKSPKAVVVLDEIEKAHPNTAKNFLSAFGENGYVDQNEKVPSNQAVFILTSNLAKDLIHERVVQDPSLLRIPPEKCSSAFRAFRDDHITPYLKRHRLDDNSVNWFKDSEMRGRLTDVFPFMPFDIPIVENAVNLFLSEMSSGSALPGNFEHVSLVWEQDVVEFLASSYERKPEEGLRAVRDQVESLVRSVMRQALDVDLVHEHCEIVLRMVKVKGDSQKLDLRIVVNSGKHNSIRPSSTTIAPPIKKNPASEGSWSLFSPSGRVETGDPTSAGSSGGVKRDFDWKRKWIWETRWDWLKEFLWEHRLAFLIGAIGLVLTVVAPYAAPGVVGLTKVSALSGAGASAFASASAVGAAVLPVAVVGGAGLAIAAGWYHSSPLLIGGAIGLLLFVLSPSFRTAVLYSIYLFGIAVSKILGYPFEKRKPAKELDSGIELVNRAPVLPRGTHKEDSPTKLKEKIEALEKRLEEELKEKENMVRSFQAEAKQKGTNEAETKKRHVNEKNEGKKAEAENRENAEAELSEETVDAT